MFLTEFFIIIFLILQGFIEIIVIRLPQNGAAKKDVSQLKSNQIQSLHEIEQDVNRNFSFFLKKLKKLCECF
jgi:hypothetical protein